MKRLIMLCIFGFLAACAPEPAYRAGDEAAAYTSFVRSFDENCRTRWSGPEDPGKYDSRWHYEYDLSDSGWAEFVGGWRTPRKWIFHFLVEITEFPYEGPLERKEPIWRSIEVHSLPDGTWYPLCGVKDPPPREPYEGDEFDPVERY